MTAANLTILSVAFPFASVTEDPVGGAEQVLSRLDHAITAAGHRSIVVAQSGSSVAGELRSVDAVEGEITDVERSKVHQQVRERIAESVATDRAHLIHFHGLDFASYLPAPGAPCLVSLHLPLDWYDPAALLPQRPDTWLAPVSRNQARSAPEGVQLLESIENGVPIPEDLEPKCDFALSLGRICREKGTHEALDAAREAGAELLIAGDVFPYPEHRRYWHERVRPRLDRARRWIGRIAGRRKEKLLGRAKCVLIPSRAPETSSLVAMEALAAGTPVIAYPSGALPEIVEHGRTGFIVGDAREMARAMKAVNDLDPHVCRATACERFPLEKMTSAYLAQYERFAA
jgi:glycosyltransferase involved in cell wall biosynthesis